MKSQMLNLELEIRICFAVDIWLCKSQNFICFMLIFLFFFLEEMG